MADSGEHNEGITVNEHRLLELQDLRSDLIQDSLLVELTEGGKVSLDLWLCIKLLETGKGLGRHILQKRGGVSNGQCDKKGEMYRNLFKLKKQRCWVLFDGDVER